jgi:hypothetical protein
MIAPERRWFDYVESKCIILGLNWAHFEKPMSPTLIQDGRHGSHIETGFRWQGTLQWVNIF